MGGSLEAPLSSKLNKYPYRDKYESMSSSRRSGTPDSGHISPDRTTSVLAHLVRERRRTAGLTQRALSELAGVGPRVVWDIERGKATLRMDVVNRVLAVFGKALGAIDAVRVEEPAP